MASLSNHKTVSAAPFSNDVEIIRVQYDFANDAGATGALDVLTCTEACVVRFKHGVVKTECTSGGSATLILGLSGGDTDAFLDATSGAVANLTGSAIIQPEATNPVYVAAAGKIIQTIGTATFTAGKIEYVFEIMKP